MSIYGQFATDKAAEVDGVWVDYGENEDGTIPAFKISRMSKSNKRYSKAIDAATRPYRREMDLKTMQDEKAERIFLGVFIGTVLLDWRNIKDRDGQNIEFNKANAKKLLEDLPDLYEALQADAKEAALFREKQLEEESGN